MTQRYGRITIRADGLDDPKDSQYEAQLLGMLRGLDQGTQCGAAIFTAVLFYKRDVLIYPYDGRHGKCNATSYEDWGLFGTKIAFSPFEWRKSECANTPGDASWAGHHPHELLIHELTHAVRSVARKLYDVPEYL